MKLKKIASLALAGVMAVSMLAGCSVGNGKGDADVTVTPTSDSIVAAINDGQNVTNAVKVTFTSDAELKTALEQALQIKGSVDADDVQTQVEALMVKTYTNFASKWDGDTAYNDGKLDGKDQTFIEVYKISATEALNEQAALKVAARKVNDDIVSKLVAKTDDDNITVTNNKYYSYDYKGTAAMVTVSSNDGTTAYYVVVTLTQTAAKKEA